MLRFRLDGKFCNEIDCFISVTEILVGDNHLSPKFVSDKWWAAIEGAQSDRNKLYHLTNKRVRVEKIK